MQRADTGLQIRISAHWSMLLVGAAVIGLLLPNRGQANSVAYIERQLAGAYLACAAILVWGVLLKWPVVGRWLMIALVSASVGYLDWAMDVPGVLSLLALATIAAVVSVGVRAGAITALVQTLFLLVYQRIEYVLAAETAVSLIAVWASYATVAGLYHFIYQLEAWSWSQYQTSRVSVLEARSRREELERSLQGLRRANRQLALDNRRMAGLRSLADQAQRSKAAFVSRVSHEFRAPLNMIIGLVGLMVERPDLYVDQLPVELRTDLRIIHRNSTHLAEMINDVLDLSQTEIGRLTLHRGAVDLATIIDEAREAVLPLTQKKGLDLRVHLPGRPLMVYGDRTRIRQVLLNLLSNAARFTEAGGIAIEASDAQGEVTVAVTDTGEGIPADALEHLFQPFYRVAATSSKVSGSGLGLSISREIIQHHGGRIWVESDMGQGTSFYFTVPTNQPLDPTAAPGHRIVEDWVWQEAGFRTEAAAYEAGLFRPLFVVYDPEDSLGRELQSLEQDADFLVTHTVDETLAAVGKYPGRAVLVNTSAHQSDAGELIGRVRSTADGTLVLACDVASPLSRARAAGAVDYLTKPVAPEALASAIESLGHPVRSLIVIDDESEGRALLRRMVRRLDPAIAVSEAADARSAMTAIRAQRPDLVLLDVVMPGADGWSLLESLRGDPDLAEVAVFFVSGMDPSDTPPVSDSLTVTLAGGIPAARLVEASLVLSQALLAREG